MFASRVPHPLVKLLNIHRRYGRDYFFVCGQVTRNSIWFFKFENLSTFSTDRFLGVSVAPQLQNLNHKNKCCASNISTLKKSRQLGLNVVTGADIGQDDGTLRVDQLSL